MKVILSLSIQTSEGSICFMLFFCCFEGLLRDANEGSFHQGLLLEVEEGRKGLALFKA